MDRSDEQTILCTNKSGSSIPVHGNLHGTGIKQPDDYPKNNRSRKYNNYNKYLLPVVLCLTSIANALPASAEVGGVSATAAPVANSSAQSLIRQSKFYKAHISLILTGGGSSVKVPP